MTALATAGSHSPYLAALLTGGDRHLIATAVVALAAAGRVQVTDGGSISRADTVGIAYRSEELGGASDWPGLVFDVIPEDGSVTTIEAILDALRPHLALARQNLTENALFFDRGKHRREVIARLAFGAGFLAAAGVFGAMHVGFSALVMGAFGCGFMWLGIESIVAGRRTHTSAGLDAAKSLQSEARPLARSIRSGTPSPAAVAKVFAAHGSAPFGTVPSLRWVLNLGWFEVESGCRALEATSSHPGAAATDSLNRRRARTDRTDTKSVGPYP